jgi:lysophospholipase L1-like esterase
MVQYDRDADLNVPRPGYEVSGGRINIKINSLGFRGDEFTREKPANTVRVACLGASTTFCAEVSSNHHTWPYLLQERLRKAYPGVNIEVVNAALGGYVSEDNLKNLRHRVMPLDPDLVLYYEANNEIVHDTQLFAAREGLLRADGARQSPLVTSLSKYSLMFDLAYKNLAIMIRSRAASGDAKKLDRVPADLPAHFISVLDQMRADLAAKDVPFVLSTFIVKYRRSQDRATQIKNADVEFYYMPWMSIDGMLDAMDVYNQAILDYASRAALPVVDDREAVPADAEHYSDCMHFLDKGAEAMADRFARYILETGALKNAVSRAQNRAK